MDDYKMISPKEYKELFAPKIGIAKIRELFKEEGFPAVQIGAYHYTTVAAAKEWLSNIGESR